MPAPSPGEGFKRGFVVMVYSPKFFGGAAEFASASIHLSNAIKDVYAQYEAGKGSNSGKLPVVTCTGSQPMKDRYGTNYRPTFTIAQWVDRPTDLPSVSPVEAADSLAEAAPRARQGGRPACAGAQSRPAAAPEERCSDHLEGFGPPALPLTERMPSVMSNVQPMFEPDAAQMRRHVGHLFEGWLDGCHEGRIELAWTDARDGKLRHAASFGTDELDELVERAVRENRVQGQNVYIGQALRQAKQSRRSSAARMKTFSP